MRRTIIAGNWKMNKTPEEAVALIQELKPLVKGSKGDVVVCVPFICLPAAAQALKGSNMALGAQNMHFKDSGAFTGEISPVMLKTLGVQYVIIGHSERRQYFAETDETVNLKVKAAFAHDLTPIVCVGESLAQREQGITNPLVCGQTQKALAGLTGEQVKKVVIAYEPIWAIGTGKTATVAQADEVIGVIRGQVAKDFGQGVAEALRIQYGGSMNPSNVKELMAMPQIDGGLIGGASLKAQDFTAIVNYEV